MTEKDTKNKLRLTSEHTEKLRLLETIPLFRAEVAKFRKKFLMEVPSGRIGVSLEKETPLGLWGRIVQDLYSIGEKFNLPYNLMEKQVFFYIKHNQWGFDPATPKEYFEPTLTAPINYHIINEPMAELGEDGKMVKYSETVSLVTYARLSTKEEKEALRLLRERQKFVLNPDLTKHVRRKKNIERDIAVKKEMATREPKHREERLIGYLKAVRPQYDKGQSSMQKFKELKKLHPNDVEILKVGKSSSDVAQKALGGKKHAANARQIASRLKKKMKRFGNNL